MEMAKFGLIFSISLAALGCTKSSPTFESLDSSNLPQPLFFGRTSVTKETASPLTIYQIDGQCDHRIRDIVGSVREVNAAPQPLSQLGTTVNVKCSTLGTFSFVLKSLTGLGITPAEGATYHVDLRAMTSAGLSNPSVINIHFSSLNGPDAKHLLLTSGSTESNIGSGARVANSTNYNAVIRVSNRAPAYSSTPKADEVERNSANVRLLPVFPQQSP